MTQHVIYDKLLKTSYSHQWARMYPTETLLFFLCIFEVVIKFQVYLLFLPYMYVA